MVRKADSRVAYLLGLCTPTFYSFFFFNINLFIYLFIFGCFWFFVAVCGFLKLRRAGATLRCSVWASHCSGFCCCGARALGARASVVVARGLGSCGTRGQLPSGMWDLPRPGLEPMSPALAGGFLSTVPPGKPNPLLLFPQIIHLREGQHRKGRMREAQKTSCLNVPQFLHMCYKTFSVL